MMIILIKLFLISKRNLIRTVKFFKQLVRIQIQKGGKVLLWNQVKSIMEAWYSELILVSKLENFCSWPIDFSNFVKARVVVWRRGRRLVMDGRALKSNNLSK